MHPAFAPPPPPSPLAHAVADYRRGAPGKKPSVKQSATAHGVSQDALAAELDRLGIPRMRSNRPINGRDPAKVAAAVDAVLGGASLMAAARTHGANVPAIRAALSARGYVTPAQLGAAQRAGKMAAQVAPAPASTAAQPTHAIPVEVRWEGSVVVVAVLGRMFPIAKITAPVAGPFVAELYDWAGSGEHLDVPCRSEAEARAVVTALLAIRGVVV